MDERDMQLEANFQTQLLTQEGTCFAQKYYFNIDFDKLMEDFSSVFFSHAICRLLTFYLSFGIKTATDFV